MIGASSEGAAPLPHRPAPVAAPVPASRRVVAPAGASGAGVTAAARARRPRGGPAVARAVRVRGFTLIELLVTITIIAILTGAVLLTVDFRNVGTSVRDTARRTELLMELAADQAVYAGTQFGIRFHPESYEFWILAPAEEGEDGEADEEPTWQPFFDERLNYAPPDVPIEFEVEISGVPIVLAPFEEEIGDSTDEDPLKPHVLFLSNGEVIPDFSVTISDSSGEYRHVIATGEIEPIVLETPESP